MNIDNTQALTTQSYPFVGNSVLASNTADVSGKTAPSVSATATTAAVSVTGVQASGAVTSGVDLTSEQSKAMVEKVNSVLKQSDTELQFQFDKGAGKMVLYLKDTKTGETLRQIPGEAALRMSKDIDTYLEGLKSHQNAKDAVGQLSGLITNMQV